MLALSRHAGLTTFDSEVIDFSGTRALVIERYDRVIQRDGQVQRLHQEDFSQALGLSWVANAKFESFDTGAQHRTMAALLDSTATAFGDEFAQRKQLLSYVTFNVAIGNTDAHTKNYSLIHSESGRVKLAPLYDLTPLAFNYEGRQELALYVDGRKLYSDVTNVNLVNEGVSWGIPQAEAALVVQETLEKLDFALQDISGPESIHEDINGFIRERVSALLVDSEAQTTSLNIVPPSIRAAQGTLGPAYPRVTE
jgi:serine/threonine-protein kinase HipA